MDDFKLAFFCFLLLICYFITTFSLINAVPFRHCVLCFFFFNYFTQFDSSSFVCWLTFQFIYLLVTFFFEKKRETVPTSVLEKCHVCFVCDLPFVFIYVERSRRGNPGSVSWRCERERTVKRAFWPQKKKKRSKKTKLSREGWTRNLHTKN